MNWKQAFALGLCSVGAYAEQREPVAYLYNGVRLPPVPKYDKTKYPYAAIARAHSPSHYWFVVSQAPMWMFDSESALGGTREVFDYDVPAMRCVLYTADSEWTELTEQTTAINIVLTDYTYSSNYTEAFVWANHNIEKNGSVRITATDPVPVYE